MKRVVIIGAGASGMMAGIAAARQGASVTILESGRKPGRKLLLTGNSRCNLTNLDPDLPGRYLSLEKGQAEAFAPAVLEQFTVSDTLALFEELGLLTMTEHVTWVYPVTGRSDSVLSVLLRELEHLRVRLKYNTKVTSIEMEDGAWKVCTDGWSYLCDSLVLACGSAAVPSTGSDGSGYDLCRSLGLRTTQILPVLTAVRCVPEQNSKTRSEGRPERNKAQALPPCMAGTRTNALVSVFADSEKLFQENGQVQFSQDAVSGIVTFNGSRFAARALHEQREVRIVLDLLPQFGREELACTLRRLTDHRPGDSMKEILAGILPPGLIPLFADERDPERTARSIKAFGLKAAGLRGFENCQVCAGGVCLSQLDPRTMECTAQELRGIFIAGELADIDGPCGGYNLQWAWSSGYVAGKNAGTEG